MTQDPATCEHDANTPAFDDEAAKSLPAHEVRARWPRFRGQCSKCGAGLISYASYEHYLAGDW